MALLYFVQMSVWSQSPLLSSCHNRTQITLINQNKNFQAWWILLFSVYFPRAHGAVFKVWGPIHLFSITFYSVYSIFTPTWISIVFNCPSSASCFIQCSLVHWLRLCSREIVCTCRTFRTFVRIAVYLNFHCKTNITQLMINKEKNKKTQSVSEVSLQPCNF